jgi:hypothetical protein
MNGLNSDSFIPSGANVNCENSFSSLKSSYFADTFCSLLNSYSVGEGIYFYSEAN